MSKRPGFVLLVAVKPCKLPSLADHLRRCELFGLGARLREVVRGAGFCRRESERRDAMDRVFFFDSVRGGV